MHTATSIFIRAPRERIFEMVSDLSRWPLLLPHYRFVKTLKEESPQTGSRQIVRMAATRDGIPISWVSAYEADRDLLQLRFEHLRAWTRGMKVVWTLEPEADGTKVEILHDLNFRSPWLAWVAEPVLGTFFIENIANKTLRTFKRLLETPASA